MKTKILLLLVFLFSMTISGCGAGTDDAALSPQALSEKAENNYISVPLNIPHEIIYGEAVNQHYLYYLSYEDDHAAQAILGRVDLDNPLDIRITPLDIPPNEYMKSLDFSGGELNILTFQFEGDEGDFAEAYWHRFNPDGEIINSVAVGEAVSDCEYYWVTDFKIDAKGNAYLAMSNDVFVVNPEGNLVNKLTCGRYISDLYKDTDDKILVRYTQGRARMLAFIDPESGVLESSQEITALGEIIGFGANTGDKFFLADLSGANTYNINDKTKTELFTWSLINVAVGAGDRIFPLPDDRMLWVDKPGLGVSIGTPASFNLIRPMTAAEIAGAEEAREERERKRAEEEAFALENAAPDAVIPTGSGNITLGTAGWYLGDAAKEAVAQFNTNNPDSRIEIIEYGNKNYGSDDYDDGFLQLNADIVSGKCPDILILPPQMSFGLYAQKGLLRDLYPYFESDESINLTDFQENILKAYEIDGKLYGMPIAFYVESLVGKAADLGDIKEWNLDELIAFTGRFPDSNIFHRPTKFQVLQICLKANGENLIDWSGEGSGFNRDLFIKMMEFANRFTADDKYHEDRIFIDRIQDGDIRLEYNAANVGGTQYAMEIFGEPVSFVGYPSESGSGFIISSDLVVAISQNCQFNATAFSFIKSLLTEEFQSHDYLPGYPVCKKSLEKRFEREKTPIGSISMGDSSGIYLSYDLRNVTDEEFETFIDMINKADKIRVFDHEVDMIIMEEAGYYFSGTKSIAEVANIVENRIGIYIMESR